MQLVDRISSAGYSYVAPTVDKACTVVPLLGKAKARIEPYPSALIQKADLCIDCVYTTAEGHAVALRDKTQKVVGQSALALRFHKSTLAFVDTLDMLIDRYLPEPATAGAEGDTKTAPVAESLVPRLLKVPFKIPARMVHITIFKAKNGAETVKVNVQWAIKLTADQKAKLQAMIRSRCNAIVDRASSSKLAVSLQQGKEGASKRVQAAWDSVAAGTKSVQVTCYKVFERLHIIEIKEYTVQKTELLQQSTVSRTSRVFMAATQRAYNATAFVAGQERANGIFTVIGKRLPIVKMAISPAASTGSESNSSTDGDANVDPSASYSSVDESSSKDNLVEEAKPVEGEDM